MVVTLIFLAVLIGGMVIGMPIAHALILTGVARLCCTSRKADEITPAPDAAMPWHPRAPCSGARVA